jgi:hypothetical protein
MPLAPFRERIRDLVFAALVLLGPYQPAFGAGITSINMWRVEHLSQETEPHPFHLSILASIDPEPLGEVAQ